jgi:glucose-1-phosphate thymidylyltransferase
MKKIEKEGLKKDVVGLIPGAGKGTRIGPLPFSKEIYPIGFEEEGDGRPKTACSYLLGKMRSAGVEKVYIILRAGKWDIPAYFQNGKSWGVRLAYLVMNSSSGTPYTVDQAFPFVRDDTIVFGFPDILFEPEDAFVKLLDRLAVGKVDVVLGLFPSDNPRKTDMVDLEEDGRITRIDVKPEETQLCHTWGIAVWTPRFTYFMHEYLKVLKRTNAERELFVGDVIRAAIDEGLYVEGIHVSGEPYLDIGTPEDLLRATRQFNEKSIGRGLYRRVR